jgi:hypothetical protein
VFCNRLPMFSWAKVYWTITFERLHTNEKIMAMEPISCCNEIFPLFPVHIKDLFVDELDSVSFVSLGTSVYTACWNSKFTNTFSVKLLGPFAW